jgi:hypothetical protein
MQTSPAMGDPVEAAYIAVERAYGEGRFAAALEQALALEPQLQAGRSDQLDLRLQLLIGHIHYYGLQQPRQAASAYGQVLQQSSDSAYQALASQGLELCRQQESAAVAPAELQTSNAREARSQGAGLPATPWLNQLRDPEQALQEIRTAWSTTIPSLHRSSATRLAAGPLSTGEATDALSASEPAPLEPACLEPSPDAPTPGDAAPAEDSLTTPDPEAWEEPENPSESKDAVEAASEPAGEPNLGDQGAALVLVPDEPPNFSPEEWAEYARGLLLVELSSQPGTMR